MYLTIIYLPLIASIISGFFGRKIGIIGAQIINTSCIIITTILSILVFFEVGFNNIPVSLQLFNWINSESLNVFWAFNFDSLTVSMLIPVLIVSSLVHLYSIGYMSHDPHNQRFFSYLSLFTFMMIILVTANNYLLMFVGWEGVGICSYLLVSFWFTKIAANQSSVSAFLTNRVGDCFLTIGMFAILWSFGNIDFTTVFSLSGYVNETIIIIIGLCLLIGAMAKSSQIGLHVWLPQAMEGPTPVSALIHAATMVTAGVYLLMRSSPLIEYSSTVLLLCLWIGAVTTIFSSLIGLFQQDIKKVIAYSTMSQLGMMVLAIGLSSHNIALFHLVNHAFYKALLFLGAGSVIHAVSDNQDFRKYGGLGSFLPLTYSVILIASLSLVAFPFMTGFYSKDFILESAYGQYYFSSIIIYFIATIGAMFTTLYSVKVLYVTFLSNPSGSLNIYKNAHESDIFMSIPLIILAIFSIFFGFVTKDLFIGLGSGFFNDNSLFIHPNHEIMIGTEFGVPVIFKLLPLILTIMLSVVSIFISESFFSILMKFKSSKLGYNLFSFFNQRFYVELFYNTYITDIILKLGGHTTKILDKGSIELIGPYGLEKLLLLSSNNISKLDTGIVTSYALYILVGLISYVSIPHLNNYNVFILIIFNLSYLISSTNKGISSTPSLPFHNSSFSNLKSSFNIFFFKNNVKNYLLIISIIFLICISIRIPCNMFLKSFFDNHQVFLPIISMTAAILNVSFIYNYKGMIPDKVMLFISTYLAFIVSSIFLLFIYPIINQGIGLLLIVLSVTLGSLDSLGGVYATMNVNLLETNPINWNNRYQINAMNSNEGSSSKDKGKATNLSNRKNLNKVSGNPYIHEPDIIKRVDNLMKINKELREDLISYMPMYLEELRKDVNKRLRQMDINFVEHMKKLFPSVNETESEKMREKEDWYVKLAASTREKKESIDSEDLSKKEKCLIMDHTNRLAKNKTQEELESIANKAVERGMEEEKETFTIRHMYRAGRNVFYKNREEVISSDKDLYEKEKKHTQRNKINLEKLNKNDD